MRSNLGNKPLSHVMKDTSVLKYTLDEMVKLEKLKKEEAMLADPKTKIFGMMLKATRLKREKEEEIATQKEAEEAEEEDPVAPSEETTESKVKYNPKRQDFCMMYVIYKNI